VPLAIAGAHDAGDVFIGLAKLITTGIGLRLLIGAVDRWSAGSLLAVALLHAGFNASSDLIEPGHDVIRLALTVVLGAAAALVVTVRTHSSRTH